MKLKATFGHDKPIIAWSISAAARLAALRRDGRHGEDHRRCRAQDIEALQEGGVDAVMFGNEGDRPYLLKASPVIARRHAPMRSAS